MVNMTARPVSCGENPSLVRWCVLFLRPLSSTAVYLGLSGASAFFFAVFGTVSSVYRIQTAGLSPLQLILIGTVLELSVFIFEVPTGIVADLYSRRRSVVIGMFLIGAGFVLEGLFPIFATMLVAQVIWGVGATFESGAKEAWVADELGAERVGDAYLQAAQVGQIASLAGVAVATLLGSVYLGLPLVAGGTGFFGIGVFLLLFMREDDFVPEPGNGHPLTAMRETLRTASTLVRRTPALLTILVITGVLGASSETFDRLWEARILRIGLPDLGALPDLTWFGLISAGATLLSLLATEGVRRTERSSRFTVVLLAGISALLMLSVIGFGLAGNFALALAFYWSAYLLRRVNAPLFAAWLNGYLEPRTRATVFSLNAQTDALGQIAGGPLLGLLANVTLRGAFGAAGLLLLPAVFLYLRLLRRR